MEEEFSFDLLKRKQLLKIIEGYNLPIDKSLSTKKLLQAVKEHLEVTDDGYIVEKEKSGGAEPDEQNLDVEFYLSDKNGKDHKLEIQELIKTLKNSQDIKTAMETLHEFYEDILYNIKQDNELHTIRIFQDKRTNLFKIFADFLVVNADKLSDVLCQKQLNVKYVRAYAHPELNDYLFINVLHKDKKVIIKGFAFTNTDKDELYVSTVCGTGGTAKIFKYMIDGMKMNEYKENLTHIKLDSVDNPNTINFYSKLGFRKTDKDTKSIISAMYKSKAKFFDSFVKETKLTVGGPMYLFVPDTRGERALKKKKCHYVYTPKEWFIEIKKGNISQADFMKSLKSEKLEGAGLGDFFKGIYNKASDLVKRAVTKGPLPSINEVKQVINPYLERYTNRTKKILNEFGNAPVQKLSIVRTPVKSIVMGLVNLITLGKFDELKKQYNFDKMFHLGLLAFVETNGKRAVITIEKNERIELTMNKKYGSDTEFFNAPMGNKEGQITINQMLNNAQGCMGTEKFFDYDAFENNCQVFIMKVLECSGMLDSTRKEIILQEVGEIAKQLPETSKNLMKTLTTIGAVVSRLRGAGRVKVMLGKKNKMKGSGGYTLTGIELSPEQWEDLLNYYKEDPRYTEILEKLKQAGFTKGPETTNQAIQLEPKAKGLHWSIMDPQPNRWYRHQPGTDYYEYEEDPALNLFVTDNPQYLKINRLGKSMTVGERANEREANLRKLHEEDTSAKFIEGFMKYVVPVVTTVLPGVGKAFDVAQTIGSLATGQDLGADPETKFEEMLQEDRKTAYDKMSKQAEWRLEPTRQTFFAYPPTKRWVKDGVGALLNQDGSLYLDRQGRTNRTSGYWPDVDIFFRNGHFTLPSGEWVDRRTLEPKKTLTPEQDAQKLMDGDYNNTYSLITGHSNGKPYITEADAYPVKKTGYGKNLELQSVIVKKPISLEQAKKVASEFTKKSVVRETGTSYRFRNIPKQRFVPKSFITKRINKDVSLVLGHKK